jgi:hypothetical protein
MTDLTKLQNQYLSNDELLNKIPVLNVTPNELGTTDSYHEEKILNTYLKLDNDGQILVYKAALQLAIVGYGNKNYGFVRKNEEEIINLVDIFNQYNIKYLERQNSKFKDDELSARRLLRLFRCQIQKFIINNKRPSYLWLKYANKVNIDFIGICFPGGEHLLETKEEAIFLLDTYGNIDNLLNTKFRGRLKRVFIARGILNPEYFIDKNY